MIFYVVYEKTLMRYWKDQVIVEKEAQMTDQ